MLDLVFESDISVEGISPEPREWRSGRLIFQSLGPDEFSINSRAYVNQAEVEPKLEKFGDKLHVCINWPASPAGLWNIRYENGQSSTEATIKIQPSKITGDQLSMVMQDLDRELPASIIFQLDRMGAFISTTTTRFKKITIEQEIEILKRAVLGHGSQKGLLSILPEVSRDPHFVLSDELHQVRSELARRLTAQGLASSLMRSELVLYNKTYIPTHVLDTKKIQNFDTYENKVLREYVTQVQRRLRQIIKHTRDRYPYLQDWYAKLGQARKVVAFLDSVGNLKSPPELITMVFLKKPAYRSAYDGYLSLRRSYKDCLTVETLDLPFQNVPYLYEKWCTLHTILALLRTADKSGFRTEMQSLYQPSCGGNWVEVIPDGRSALRLKHANGTRISLIPQQSYRPDARGRLKSISFCQIPDISIEVAVSDNLALYVLDPKYKLEGDDGPKKEDIDKMHAYRDSIRDADGRRIVRSAVILYPGESSIYYNATSLGAISMIPGSDACLNSLDAFLLNSVFSFRPEASLDYEEKQI